MPSPVHYLLQQTAGNGGVVGLMNSADFILPLTDAGAGAVSVLLPKGTGPATFTRALATATTIGSTGLVLKAIGANVARSYYDPTTLNYLGYLAEGARTNLLLQSEDFATTWSFTDTTVTVNAATAPDGTATADSLTEGSAGTAAGDQAITMTADATATVSFFVKPGNHTWIRIAFFETATSANSVTGYFNLSSGVVGTPVNGGTATGGALTIKGYPNGWYRCTVAGAVNNAATAVTCRTASATADGNAARVSGGLRYQWGAQFEDAAAFASTYIPTTTAAVTRNADVLTYPFAGNASATAGSAYGEFSTLWATPGAGVNYMGIDFVAGVTGSPIYNSSTADSTKITMNDGTNSTNKTGLTDMSTAVRKRASSWGGSAISITGDGAAVATTSFDGDMGSTAIAIGANTAGTSQWYGTIKNVRIWQRQLPDQTLRAITT